MIKSIGRAIGIRHDPVQLVDVVIGLIEAEDFTKITLRDTVDSYAAENAVIDVRYLSPDCFEEIQISFGYEMGKGVTVVIRNYIEHLIVLNHEIMGQFQTIEYPIHPDIWGTRHYWDKFSRLGEEILAVVEPLKRGDYLDTVITELSLMGSSP
jgi:hypothetical protein